MNTAAFLGDVGDLVERAQANCIFPFVSRVEWSTTEPETFVSGRGCILVDMRGREILDGLSSMSRANSLGYANREIADALFRQTMELHYVGSQNYVTPPQIALAEKIVEKAPRGFSRVFFTSGGSEAVEAALKLAKQYQQSNGKPHAFKTISRWNSYHGSTMGALSVSDWLKVKEVPDPRLPGHSFIPNPMRYRNPLRMETEQYADYCARFLERQILLEGPETVAAFIAEPIQQANGVQITSPSYWRTIKEICDKYNVLLIVDEIITSFGRSGRWFISEEYGIDPDIITTAKALSAGYFPLGAVVAKEHLIQGIDSFKHVHTFSGHAAGCAVALAAITIKEREGLVERARQNASFIQDALGTALNDNAHVGEIRGVGHWHAVDLTSDRESRLPVDEDVVRRIAKEAFRRGVLIGANGTSLELAPPLIATRAEIERIVSLTAEAVVAVLYR